MRVHRGLLGVLLVISGCKDHATAECQAQLTKAQPIVAQVKSSSRENLNQALAAVEAALTACRAAGRSEEAEQLARAQSELKVHLDSLATRGEKKRREKPSAEQIEELIKKGDVSCPRGMAYKAEGSERQIKCIGPQPVKMSLAVAREYYKGLGFRVTPTDNPPGLKAEYGAELMVFSYATSTSPAPRCLAVYPEPRMPWQEVVARATGAPLNKIKEGAPVPLADGPVPLRVDEGKDKLVIWLGECP
jgi:hypothetical protein